MEVNLKAGSKLLFKKKKKKELNKLILLIQRHFSHHSLRPPPTHTHRVTYEPPVHLKQFPSIRLPDLVPKVAHEQTSILRAHLGAYSDAATDLVKVIPVKLKEVFFLKLLFGF